MTAETSRSLALAAVGTRDGDAGQLDVKTMLTKLLPHLIQRNVHKSSVGKTLFAPLLNAALGEAEDRDDAPSTSVDVGVFFDSLREMDLVGDDEESISHPPHSASLIAHTRLTLSFLSYQAVALSRTLRALTDAVATLVTGGAPAGISVSAFPSYKLRETDRPDYHDCSAQLL
jgi:hypothetical protein